MAESLSTKYKVPATLRPLLEAFARETLRSQPADLIDFGLQFFDALSAIQKTHPRADIIGEEKLYNQFRTALQQRIRAGGPSEAAREPTGASARSSGRMQPPQHSQPGSSAGSRAASPTELAATKIQAAYRGHFVRNHPEKFGIDTVDLTRRRSNDRLNSADTKKDLKRHSVGGYSLEQTTASPDDRAATLIQAEIRGFLARKHVEAMKQKNAEAAVKIQAHIRGFLTRKKLDGSPRSSPRSEDIIN